MSEKVLRMNTDVLVIGAGGAGLRAALEAWKQGARVTICLKGCVGASGATANDSCELAMFNATEHHKEEYYSDIMDAALGVCDPAVAHTLVNDAILERDYLNSIGVPFERDKRGEYIVDQSDYSKRKRSYVLPEHGRHIVKRLSAEISKTDIQILEDTVVTRVFVKDRAVQGVFALKKDSGYLFIAAKSVVLCAGGAGQMFLRNMSPEDVTGDGYALALHAGASLTNMEFTQCGIATVYPTYNLLGLWMLRFMPTFKNKEGQDFLSKHIPEGVSLDSVIDDKLKHWPYSTRDNSKYLEISIHKEILSGNGTEHQGVFLDFSKIFESSLDDFDEDSLRLWDMGNQWFSSRGIDLREKPAEIAVFAHAINGGPLIDENGCTDISGLYAAGENAAGPHGADRLGGNMMVTCQVFGKRAGRHAAMQAKKCVAAEPAQEVINEEIKRLSFAEIKSGTYALSALKDQLQVTMWENMVAIKTEKGMKKCMLCIEEIAQALSDVSVMDFEDQKKAIELSNMLDVARIMIAASSERKESRGSHYREDYPHQDDVNFCKNVFVREKNGELCVSVQSIEDFRKTKTL